jgi:hypothetical protein
MDVVITYVDGNDPVWQQDYEKYTNVPVMQKRFRDWGTLKYLLRGVETNMPYIRNVYLVVSHNSQVPSWVCRDNLKVVLHGDIIPEEHLPTFNSTTIEMFLHRIEGLDEEFIYFNDDIFPVAPSMSEDFFREGKAVIGMSRHLLASSMYKKHVRRSDMMAREALGLSRSLCFVRSQHSCMPLLKSQCKAVFERQKSKVLSTLSKVRDDGNINMTLFLSYMYHQSLVVNERISCGHISLGAATAGKLVDNILSPKRKFVCINDVKLSEERYQSFRNVLVECFERRFPNKSRFEK